MFKLICEDLTLSHSLELMEHDSEIPDHASDILTARGKADQGSRSSRDLGKLEGDTVFSPAQISEGPKM